MKRTPIWKEIGEFFTFLFHYFRKQLFTAFRRFEATKDFLVGGLVVKRGRYTRPFIHSGMAILVVLGILLAPLIGHNIPGFAYNPWEEVEVGVDVFGSRSFQNEALTTLISVKPRATVIDYKVKESDTVSGIAEKFGISTDSIRWANDLKSIDAIKPGDKLKILPVSGIAHKVKRGETIYSISKKYQANAQAIVDYPFNEFSNDETFTLVAGQNLIVPDGIMPQQKPWQATSYLAKTPDAGVVSATGQFVWPTSGNISQRFRWYHRGLDIANKAAPGVVAADSGKVILAGYPDRFGYGNRVIINHGNGFTTLYAHLSKIYVKTGQTVNRGDSIGQMGGTGRSTGIHLHIEIRYNGVAQDPLRYLK